MSERTDILIEKSLRGLLGAEESAELERALAADPEARAYLERLRLEEEILDRHARAGLERIDWTRVQRLRRRLSLHHLVVPLAFGVLVGWGLWALLEVEPVWRKVGHAFGLGLASLWLANALLERRRSRRLFAWFEEGDGAFLDRYRMVLEREWRRIGSGWFGTAGGVAFLLILALVGRQPEACLAASAIVVLAEIYKRIVVLRPLRREREALRS